MTLRQKAEWALEAIEAFDKECQEAEYTDTEAAWLVFQDVTRLLTEGLNNE